VLVEEKGSSPLTRSGQHTFTTEDRTGARGASSTGSESSGEERWSWCRRVRQLGVHVRHETKCHVNRMEWTP
jgi:hypothetical protein